MEAISSELKHPKSLLAFSASILFEKAGYYGIRSLVVIYLISETIGMTNEEALSVYGWVTMLIVLGQIPGGILGDLVLGNKWAIFIGAILQAIGAFVICIPGLISLYLGLGLIVLGNGLYSPNILAQVGKSYKNRLKLMDGGFMILYTAINIGAIIGVVSLSFLIDFSFILGFALGGIFMLLSALFIFFVPDNVLESTEQTQTNWGINTLKVLAAILLVGLFWMGYELHSSTFYMHHYESLDSMDQPWKAILQSGSSNFTIVLGVFACIIWSFFYSSRLFKLTLGFTVSVFAVILAYLLPEDPTMTGFAALLPMFLLMALAEILVAPIIHSVISKNVNPKYLAIVFGIVFIPARLFNYISGKISDLSYETPNLGLNVSLGVFGILGLVLLVIWILRNTGILDKIVNNKTD